MELMTMIVQFSQTIVYTAVKFHLQLLVLHLLKFMKFSTSSTDGSGWGVLPVPLRLH